jgi:hypothetical protein
VIEKEQIALVNKYRSHPLMESYHPEGIQRKIGGFRKETTKEPSLANVLEIGRTDTGDEAGVEQEARDRAGVAEAIRTTGVPTDPTVEATVKEILALRITAVAAATRAG